FGGQSIKSNVKYVPKAAVSVPKTGAANVSGSSFLKNKPPKESEEEVENIFDESVNLLRSVKTKASSSTYSVPDGYPLDAAVVQVLLVSLFSFWLFIVSSFNFVVCC
ncbi:hypothetical protein Tco_1422568, partial [Tanacetum coccineum]